MRFLVLATATCLCVWSTCLSADTTETRTFRMNSGSPESVANSTGDGFYNLIAAEVFRRLNIPLEFIRVQSLRALIQVNKGIDDGNIARIEGIEKKWTNLIRVPESFFTFEFTAFSLSDDIPIDGWDSLKPYTVGHVRGWYIYHKNTKGVKKVLVANDDAQLFNLLKQGRIKIALYERYQAPFWYKQVGFVPKRLSKPLAKKKMYIYVNKKHKALVPRMAEALREMKQDGTYQKIFDRAFKTSK